MEKEADGGGYGKERLGWEDGKEKGGGGRNDSIDRSCSPFDLMSGQASEPCEKGRPAVVIGRLCRASMRSQQRDEGWWAGMGSERILRSSLVRCQEQGGMDGGEYSIH